MKKCHTKAAVSGFSLLMASSLAFCCASFASTLEFNDGSSLLSPGKTQSSVFSKDFRFNHLISGSKVFGHNFADEQVRQLTKEGIKVGKNTENNYLSLEEGNLLLAPDKNIIVGTKQGNLYISSGAVVFIIESDKGLVLYDLRQNFPKQVSFAINKQQVYVEPGYVLVLATKNTDDYEKLDLDCHAVLYGNPEKISSLNKGVDLKDKSGKDLSMFAAEFSVSAAFLTIEPLRQLTASSNKQDKMLFEKILRGAATLHDFLGPIQPSQLATRTRQL